MSQKNVQIDVCQVPNCGKAWLTHHTFNGFTADGRPSFHCHKAPVAKTDTVVAFLVGLRTESLTAKAELKELKLSREADKQATKAAAELEFNAKVKAEASKLAAAEVAKMEQTLVQKHAEFEAKILDQKQLLEEVRGDNRTLREEKTVIAGKLAESERELDELKTRHTALEVDVKYVLDGSETLADELSRLNLRLKECGKKVVATPAPIVIPTVLPPAPKAVAVAEPVAVAVTAPVAPAPVAVSVWGDSEPAPSASADDEGEVSIGDDAVIGEMEVGSDDDNVSYEDDHAHSSDEDDDESSEEDEDKECRGCDKIATHGFSYMTRYGTQDRLQTCNPRKHAEEFLAHLRTEAVIDPNGALNSIPQKAGQLVKLLKEHPLTTNRNPNQTTEDQDA